MYQVALIQNQSEMSHYGYADARPILEEFGYKPILYTAQNIEKLSTDLAQVKFDAIIFASNALNDKTIRGNVVSDEFKESFISFIKNGKGCLILHQLRMAQDCLQLNFLPTQLSEIRPEVRNENEKASDGKFHPTSISREHVFFLYPNMIDINEVQSRCLSFRSLKGLYWHFWGNASGMDWNVLLYDIDQQGLERPLIITSKESEPFRITLCALTLDWQKQKALLQNILFYIIEGKHDLAILKDFQNVSFGFEYFIESLRAQKYPLRIYDINQNLEELQRNIQTGVHTIIFLGPFVTERKIGSTIMALINDNIIKGELKLVSITAGTEEDELSRFYIAGREKYAKRILHELELKLQQELSLGYIDGGFWSTVESLQILKDLSSQLRSRYDNQMLSKVLELSCVHNRNGSYDEVFGVTCALLWLRATYLEKDSPETQNTLKWIRNNLEDYEDREKALAYFTIMDVNLSTDEENKSLRNLLLSQQDKLDHLTEIDLIVYLKSALRSGTKEIIPSIINILHKNQEDDGYWVDLATTATATSTLLDALSMLKQEYPKGYDDTRIILEPMIFKSIIYIQTTMEKTNGSITYPWDNKATTSLKCIQAWLNFENLITLPVHELSETLKIYSIEELIKSSTGTSLTILDELRKENIKYIGTLSKLSVEFQKTEQFFRRKQYILIALLIVSLIIIYISISLIIYSILFHDLAIKALIKGAFFDQVQIHITLLTLVATIVAIIVAIIVGINWKQKSRVKDQNDNEIS